MLLLHIAYSEEDAAAHIQFAFGQYSHAACLYVFEIHRKKSHPLKCPIDGNSYTVAQLHLPQKTSTLPNVIGFPSCLLNKTPVAPYEGVFLIEWILLKDRTKLKIRWIPSYEVCWES